MKRLFLGAILALSLMAGAGTTVHAQCDKEYAAMEAAYIWYTISFGFFGEAKYMTTGQAWSDCMGYPSY